VSAAADTRWGFVATGGIAARLAGELALVEGAVPLAVASRDAGRARAFADAHGFERAYGSYAELVADPDVDVVYVATPHAQHHAVVRSLLDAGTAVLVEKPMTCTADAARDLVGLARERGTFLMEAMWTRFQPLVARLRALVADGAIGQLRTVTAEFGFRADPAAVAHRLLDPAQGGGALLDLGVYPVAFAQMLLGAPSSVAVTGSLASTGVDAEAALLLGWPGGEQALLSTSLISTPGGGATLIGTRGRIELEAPFHRTPRLVVHRAGAGEPEVVEAPYHARGYVHQLEHVQDCLARGLVESPVMPLADTLAVAQVLDTAMRALGAAPADEGFTLAG
jgi:predicted dehydrogenase